MLACPFGPEWDLLVNEVGKFEAYRDYLQYDGEIRTPEEVRSKLEYEKNLKPGDLVSERGGVVITNKDQTESLAAVGEPFIREAVSELDEKSYENSAAVGGIKAFAQALAGQMTIDGKNLQYQFLTPEEARRLTEGKTNPWNGEKAFYIGDTVYFVGENITLSDVFHEFSHPFVRTLAMQNLKLFDKLYNDVINTEEGRVLRDQVKQAYPELSEEDDLFKEEIIVRSMTKAAELDRSKLALSSPFAKFMKDLLYGIRQMLRKIFGSKANVSKLKPTTSIKELANMLKEGENFMLDPSVLEGVDTVAYIRDFNNYIQDINKISRPELLSITIKAHDIALKHIDTVMKNKNYKEMASILADEYNRGDLQEIRRNLSKFAKPLEDKLREKRDEVEYNKAHAQAIVNTLFRLDNVVSKIKKHLAELSKDPDSIDNMYKTYYYDYLLRYWSSYIDEVIETMDEAEVPHDSGVSQLVTGIKRNIQGAEKYSKKMYEKGVKEVLFAEMRPMAERIAERYSKIIEKLKERNAPQKLIDAYHKEFYGLTQEELARKNELQKFYNEGSISKEGKNELTALKRKSFDGAQITDEKIELALKGELRDGNIFNSFFEGYMYNTDPVVGGFARFIKNQMSDVVNRAMHKFNDYAKDLQPLLEAAGYNPANVNDLIEKVARRELVGRKNEKGEWVETEVWTLKSAHTGWRIALDRLRRDIDDAQREYSEKGTSEAHQKLVELVGQKKKLLRDYFHQEYDQRVYARDYMLEKGYRVVDGIDISLEAAYRRDFIFERMQEVANPLSSQIEEFEASEKLDDLWREYHQLFSFVNLDGSLKTGVDLEIAKLLKEYREAAIDPETGESFYEWKLRKGLFENSLFQYEQELALKFPVGSDQYNEARKSWIDKNTRVAIKPEFYKERQEILNAIDEILSTLPDAQKKQINSSEIWQKILDLVAGNRDEDGQPNALNLNKNGIAFVKQQQEILQEMSKKFAGLSGLTEVESTELNLYWEIINGKERKLTEEEDERFEYLMNKSSRLGLSKLKKKKLMALYASLQALQSKQATEYYCLVMNNRLASLDTSVMLKQMKTNVINKDTANLILSDAIIYPLMAQSKEFEEWFRANHIQKDVYDPATKSKKKVWERLYVWSVIRPNNEEHYEKTTIKKEDGTEEVIDGLPTLKYYARVVKPQYRTERIIGVTVDNQGNFLPRLDVPGSPYIDQEYLNMSSTDPKHYAILEKMKEHHLKNQEGLGYRSRLYLDIPRYRKNALEVVRTKKLKVVAGDLGEKNAPLLQIMVERFKNFFRKAKDEKGSEYNWEDDAMLVRADMFDNEITQIPISGLFDIEIEDTSTDVNQSLMRYMFSAERHKKLVEINPIAQALKSTVNHPDNFAKELDRINKFNFIHRGLTTYINKKGKYTRQMAVNNLIEREFEGKVDAGWTKDMPFLQNASNLILKRAAFGFFALNIPSAVKNTLGAKWQAMVHSAGGIHIDPISMARGESWAFNTMTQVSFNVYKRGPKPLNMQIADAFDAVRGRAEQKLPEAMSRTFTHDLANFSWISNFRKWTEDEAQMQLFAGMMYKQKIKQNGKEIDYINAWESVDGQLKLKDGIDVRWGNLPTEYVIQQGDTVESLASKFYMPVEVAAEIFGSKLKVGKEVTINNELFKDFRSRFHTVQMNLNGAYDKFDQPEAYRYLAYRMIAFLKRFFTPMFVNRWGFSGSMMGRKRGRINPGLGDIHEGYYITVLKTISRTFEFGARNLPHMTEDEVAAWKKTVTEVLSLIALLSLIAPMFGWDPDDPDRFEKLRQRSGDLPFFGLVPEDPEHPWNLGGWLTNHALLMTFQVRAENETFIPWPGFGTDNYYEIFTDVSSIGFGPTLKAYKEIAEYGYMDITGSSGGRYKKDAGPICLAERRWI